MLATIQKWGNSQGVRINKQIRMQSRLAVGRRWRSWPAQARSSSGPRLQLKKYKLEDLVARILKGYQAAEEDFGAPMGREEW